LKNVGMVIPLQIIIQLWFVLWRKQMDLEEWQWIIL
jgi:hypothetical protein